MYAEITSNKRKTWLLVSLFCVFVVLMFLLLGYILEIDPIASLVLGTIFAITYSLISFYTGDQVTLATQGAKQVQKKDAYELYNVVENLSITAGIPTPAIYIINDESPNAFATGRDPQHASIAITTGLLRRLNKQEVQGVIAHEISHIKNYDIRLMMIVVVLVGLIVIMSDILLRARWLRGRGSRREGNLGVIILILGIVLAILSPLIAQVIKLAVSRSREYLADASGALLTRYPDGLASALEKIAKSNTPLQRASNATAHLYIACPFGQKDGEASWLNKLFMTHPPIKDRIAKLKEMGS